MTISIHTKVHVAYLSAFVRTSGNVPTRFAARMLARVVRAYLLPKKLSAKL